MTDRPYPSSDCPCCGEDARTVEIGGATSPPHRREAMSTDTTCPRCDGCGRIADTEDGEPWSAWEKVQHLSNELCDTADDSGLVRAVVVVWEEQSFQANGGPEYSEHYAACGPGSTPVTTAGLLTRGTAMVRLALASWHGGDDDDEDDEA